MSKITAIKILHTGVWIFFNIVFICMAYAVIMNKIDKYVWMLVDFLQF